MGPGQTVYLDQVHIQTKFSRPITADPILSSRDPSPSPRGETHSLSGKSATNLCDRSVGLDTEHVGRGQDLVELIRGDGLTDK